jgi:hypothetical protein
MNTERFMIITVCKNGIFEYRMEDSYSQDVRCVRRLENEFCALFMNIVYSISIFELLDEKYNLVREINFILCEPEVFSDVEELIRCAVWHYKDEQLLVIDDDKTYSLLEEYRLAIKS